MSTIVLYPSPGMGHLVSMVELGKFILNHHPSFSITILIIPPSFNTGSTASYIRHVSATVPSIAFHHLPAVSLDLDSFTSMESVIFELLHRSNPHVRLALQSIPTVSAFIIDFFCTKVVPISDELKIPTYYFYTSGASVLALSFYLPLLVRNTSSSFKDMGDTLLDIPGVPPLPSSDMIKPLLDREAPIYNDFIEFCCNVPKSAGVLVNTFESLEKVPLKAIRQGKCTPDGEAPPIFCVGPLLGGGGAAAAEHDCLKWLDAQPSKSVIFLSFGSLGLFSSEQLKEIAVGLEKSGHRFLWTVRSPPSDDKSKRFLPPPEPDLDSLLPRGFLDRTRDCGFIVKSWAPQVAVLNHDSVGGFVTHCGWNSVLESVCAGVPMAAWPLYAEQHFNRVVLVEQMKLAVRVREGDQGFVSADKVERAVKELMDSYSGKEVRERVKEMMEEAKAAMSGGGSSVEALAELVQLWKRG